MPISLNAFASYVNQAHVNGMDQRVVVSGQDSSRVDDGEEDCGRSLRDRTIRNGNTTQARQNKEIRQQLLEAVMSNYHAKTFLELPKGVRAAFKVGILKDDMGIAPDGKTVTSGRPLTARRIKAVLAAVRKNPRVSAGGEYKSEEKSFNRSACGCAGYQLFDEIGGSRMSFKSQASAYYGQLRPSTLPNYFRMMTDAASYMTRNSDAGMNADMQGSCFKGLFDGLQTLIRNGYGNSSESVRQEAIAGLMSNLESSLDPALNGVDRLKKMLRYGDSVGRPADMPDETLRTRLDEARTTMEAAWRKANLKPGDEGASLEQKLANDVLRYVIDNWLKDESAAV